MTVRTDDRLLDTPLVPIDCRRCGATVEARKSSWAQTGVPTAEPHHRKV